MMLTAMVALAVVVVVAMGDGVKAELSGQIICYCRVCRAADPAEQLDACLCKGAFCAPGPMPPQNTALALCWDRKPTSAPWPCPMVETTSLTDTCPLSTT